jgi:RNA polymerase sigma-70 factor, ECF subfamily
MLIVNSNESEKSFTGLYNKYYDKIYNYIFRQIFNRENSEDLTSNTFLNAMDHIKKKNPRIENFNAWIYKIATNEIISFKRKDKSKKQLSIDECNMNLADFIEESPAENINEFQDFVILRKEMEKMSQVEKSLLTLHYFEKKTYPEISQIINIKENTLRPMMTRTLRKLYKKLTPKMER